MNDPISNNSNNGNGHGKTVGVDKLRTMLLQLSETHAHEIPEEATECKQMIKTYFTENLTTKLQ
jgi:hypothetical protein